jgi:hypothetical protein
LFLGLLAPFLSNAQCDTIKLVNRTRIPAHIVKVGDKQVEYKNPRDTTGPSFFVPLKMIEAFVFKNGCYEPLNKMGYKDCAKDPLYGVLTNEEYKRFIIGFDVLRLTNMHFCPSITWLFKNRRNGLHLYYDYGLNYWDDSATYKRIEAKVSNGYYKLNYLGVDLRFFPTVHKKTTLWLAFGMEAGVAGKQYIKSDTAYYKNYNNSNLYWYLTNPHSAFAEKPYYGYHFAVGFLARKKKHLIFDGFLSVGLNQFGGVIEETNKKYVFGLKIGGGLNVGFAL